MLPISVKPCKAKHSRRASTPERRFKDYLSMAHNLTRYRSARTLREEKARKGSKARRVGWSAHLFRRAEDFEQVLRREKILP